MTRVRGLRLQFVALVFVSRKETMFDTHPKSTTITSNEPSGDTFPINANETMGAKMSLRPEQPNVINEVMDELRKAVSKFPSWPTDPFHALAIIGEEFGELQQSFLKANYEGADKADRREAIQLAAMALRFLIHWDDYHVQYSEQSVTILNTKGDGR